MPGFIHVISKLSYASSIKTVAIVVIMINVLLLTDASNYNQIKFNQNLKIVTPVNLLIFLLINLNKSTVLNNLAQDLKANNNYLDNLKV